MATFARSEQDFSVIGTQPLRVQVRADTREAHYALDNQVFTTKGFGSRDRYQSFLRAALVAHATQGITAARVRDDGSLIAEQARIDALARDLQEEAPETTGDLNATDVAYAWGVGYALNGSALGASTIIKSGHLGRDWPRRYLEMGRAFAQTGGVKDFFDRLNEKHLDRQRVTEGAMTVFSIFRQHLDTAGDDQPRGAKDR
jgi:heme oxygenase